jgi:hypothetical protein
LFKVEEPYNTRTPGSRVQTPWTALTPDSIYQVSTIRADHGRNVKVYDLARLRKQGRTFSYETVIKVPVEAAMQIKVVGS